MNKKSIVKKKTGRREIVLTDEQIAEIEILAKDLTIEQIADYFGISEKTFRNIRDRNVAVFTAYKKGKVTGIREVASKLRALIDQGDVTAIIFYLKTQAGWSTESKNNNKIKLKFPDNKTPTDILDTALSVLENGEITLNDAQRIADLAIAKFNITKINDPNEEIIRERESEEQLMAKAQNLRETIEFIEWKNKKKDLTD